MRLRYKISIPVLALLLISTVTITVLNYSFAKNSVDTMMNNTVDSNLRTLISEVTRARENDAAMSAELDKKSLALTRAFAEIVKLQADAGTLNPQDAEYYQYISDIMGVSEVHIVDANGIIIGGSIEGYFGFDFHSGEQTIPFLKILEDPSYELAQEPQANATEGKYFQYIGTARKDAPGLVQVGHDAEAIQLLRGILDVSHVAANMRVGTAGHAAIISDGIVTVSRINGLTGADVKNRDWYANVASGEGLRWLNIEGEEFFTGYHNINGMTLLVMFPRAEYEHYLSPVRNSGIIGSAVSFVIMLALIIVIMRRVTKPLTVLSEKLHLVARGNFNVNLSGEGRDEIASLSRDIISVVGVVSRLTDGVNALAKDISVKGDTDARMEETEFQGMFGTMAENINGLAVNLIQDTNDILDALTEIAGGNFNYELRAFPGKKTVMNERWGELLSCLNDVYNEITSLAKNAADGNLNARADESVHRGGWLKLMGELNILVKAISEPLGEIETVLSDMADGNFTSRVSGNYKGEFDTLKKAANITGETVLTYVSEISNVLTTVADGDLTPEIKREYIGAYAPIKEALVSILESLNNSMREIINAADSVLAGANQIAQSAATLAEGSSKQASEVEQLQAAIEVINGETALNAENAENANRLSIESAVSAQNGTDAMDGMLKSMNEIKASSENISKVIKVIDDIALQTNLLALNASVEAARAGIYGKGFSVVADEVRTLAGRSKLAANETTGMIGESNAKVDEGTREAKKTSESLGVIVGGIKEVSSIISRIAEMSRAQAESIGQINTGVNGIGRIVQENSSVSEEFAGAAQELNSQAEMMKRLVSGFKIR